MQAEQIVFRRLAEGTKQFQIPLYQRTYSWGERELKQLWEDLQEQVETIRDGSEGPGYQRPSGHFIGSLVLAPGESTAGTFPRWVVVDGQQRITTLMIALAAIRDTLIETARSAGQDPPKAAARIHNTYLVNEYEEDRENLHKLVPTQADRAALAAVIDRSAEAGGDDNIGRAYNFFKSRMLDLSPEDLAGMEEVIGVRLALVNITADRGDNVYQIFESLNDTGLALSQIDLLRNHVFMLLRNLGERVYTDVWLPMQEELGSENLELLGRLDLVLRGDPRAKQNEVYRDQKQRLDGVHAREGEEGVRRELVALRRLGKQLMRVVEPESEPHPGIREALTRLRDWGNTIYQALALRLCVRLDDGRCTADQVVAALGYIESFLVRRMIAGVKTQGLNRLMNTAAGPNALETDRPVDEAVHRYLSQARRHWPSDRDLADAIRNRSFYWSGRAPQRTFVLRRLEESYDTRELLDFKRTKLSIEHVMPQTLTTEWRELLAEQTVNGESVDELHERLVHTLGNLTLTASNAELSNSVFQRKQQIFNASKLSMNREIAEAPAWGREEIEQRAEQLTARAVRLWPGPLPGGVELEDDRHTWQLLRQALVALPAGHWTSFGDLARLIGSQPSRVSTYLRTRPGLRNAHRVLTTDGEVASHFDWGDGSTRSQREVLEEEGVAFIGANADPALRKSTQDLTGIEADGDEVSPEQQRRRRFRTQLVKHQPEATVDGVYQVIDAWRSSGGTTEYGRAAETSCILQAEAHGHPIPLLRFYPITGSVEVGFQWMCNRAPFDDVRLREELRERLNKVPGVDIPEGKLELRPTFPLDRVVEGQTEMKEALDWALGQANANG